LAAAKMTLRFGWFRDGDPERDSLRDEVGKRDPDGLVPEPGDDEYAAFAAQQESKLVRRLEEHRYRGETAPAGRIQAFLDTRRPGWDTRPLARWDRAEASYRDLAERAARNGDPGAVEAARRRLAQMGLPGALAGLPDPALPPAAWRRPDGDGRDDAARGPGDLGEDDGQGWVVRLFVAIADRLEIAREDGNDNEAAELEAQFADYYRDYPEAFEAARARYYVVAQNLKAPETMPASV
jgi:hypothetical protein